MNEEKLDIVGIGNAIVDVLVSSDEGFLKDSKIEKGIMTLISKEDAERIYQTIKPEKQISGGSVANTIFSLSQMKVKTGYIGKVSDDELGKTFVEEMHSAETVYKTKPLTGEKDVSTSRCMVFVTPDADRTMCTYLGASNHITISDVDENLIKSASITYLEGYLFDREEAKKAFKHAADVAHKAGNKIALSLSDPFCVKRHHKEFVELVKDSVDILFANEDEIKAFYDTDEMPKVLDCCDLVVVTRGSKGAVISGKGREYLELPIKNKSIKVVDTTGAGDSYAAGFLYGYVKGMDLKTCGDIASVVAGEIVSQIGARPQRSLLNLLEESGLKPQKNYCCPKI